MLYVCGLEASTDTSGDIVIKHYQAKTMLGRFCEQCEPTDCLLSNAITKAKKGTDRIV